MTAAPAASICMPKCRFGPRLVVVPMLRRRWIEDLTSGEESAHTGLELNGRLALIHRRLTGRWHLGLDLNDSSVQPG